MQPSKRARPARTLDLPPPVRNRYGRVVARLIVELFVVFFGVYAAFAISEFQKAREAETRRVQLQMALVREIEDITNNTRRAAQNVPPGLARLDSLIAAGAQPPLQPMLEPVRVRTHMWEATLASGGLDLFDVPTVYELSRFYNGLNAAFEQLAQLRTLSETMLLPNLDRGVEEFYEPETGALRPKYQWYRIGMAELGNLAAEVTVMGDRLVAQLKAEEPDARRAAPAP